jgi:hypothetical protein
MASWIRLPFAEPAQNRRRHSAHPGRSIVDLETRLNVWLPKKTVFQPILSTSLNLNVPF